MKVALAPILVVPGDQVSQEPHTWNANIPVGLTWERLQRALGNPDYLLAAVHKDKVVQCLSAMKVSIRVMLGDSEIGTRPVRFQPYGYSSDCAGNAGVAFNAKPGSTLRIVVSVAGQRLDSSEDILVIPVWHVDIKDKLVGIALSTYFWTSPLFVSVLGALVLAIGSIVALTTRRPRANKQ